MKVKFLFVAFILFFACKNDKKQEKFAQVDHNQEEGVVKTKYNLDLKVLNFEEFKVFLNRKDDKTYVINFWATWCGPCVKELPYFESITKNYASKSVEVVLVSLDFPHMYEKKLIPFIKKNNLKSDVVVLNDSKENEWIGKVDKSWSGSIPATIIYNKHNRKFYETSFTYEALEKEVKQFLN